jgi:hypothetical protein
VSEVILIDGLDIRVLEIDVVVVYQEGGNVVATVRFVSVWVKEAYQLVHIVMLDYSHSEVVEEGLVAEKSSPAAKLITMNN